MISDTAKVKPVVVIALIESLPTRQGVIKSRNTPIPPLEHTLLYSSASLQCSNTD